MIKPVGRFVLVERVARGGGNIILPDEVQSNDMFDIVVKGVGPDVVLDIKPEDNLICVPNVQAVSTEEKNFFLMFDSDICGVYE